MTARDPGLQPERTLLAWRRTTLGLVANGLLLLASGHGTSGVRFGLGIVVMVLALFCWAAASAMYRRVLHGGITPAALRPERVLRLVAALVLLVGLFDLYAVVTL